MVPFPVLTHVHRGARFLSPQIYLGEGSDGKIPRHMSRTPRLHFSSGDSYLPSWWLWSQGTCISLHSLYHWYPLKTAGISAVAFQKSPSERLCSRSPMAGHFVCLLWVLNHREQLWPKSRNLSSETERKSLSSLARWGATYYISWTPGLWVSLAQRRGGAWSYEENRKTHSSAAWHLTGCFSQDDFGWRKK